MSYMHLAGFGTQRLLVRAWEPVHERPTKLQSVRLTVRHSPTPTLQLLRNNICIPHWFKTNGGKDQVLVVTMKSNGEKIGLLILARSARCMNRPDIHIRISIADHMRGQGLATELLTTLVSEARKHDIGRLIGSVDRANSASARALHKAGFEVSEALSTACTTVHVQQIDRKCSQL